MSDPKPDDEGQPPPASGAGAGSVDPSARLAELLAKPLGPPPRWNTVPARPVPPPARGPEAEPSVPPAFVGPPEKPAETANAPDQPPPEIPAKQLDWTDFIAEPGPTPEEAAGAEPEPIRLEPAPKPTRMAAPKPASKPAAEPAPEPAFVGPPEKPAETANAPDQPPPEIPAKQLGWIDFIAEPGPTPEEPAGAEPEPVRLEPAPKPTRMAAPKPASKPAAEPASEPAVEARADVSESPLDPASQRIVAKVRRLMLFSTLVTLLGVAAVFGVIGYRVFKSEERPVPAPAPAPAPVPPPAPALPPIPTDVTLHLPLGTRIIQTAVAEDRLVVTIVIDGAIEIRTFDLKTLEPLARLEFTTVP